MFDFNKLDEYKEIMENNDISSMVFGDMEHQFGCDGENYYLDKYDDEKWVPVVEVECFKCFKTEVANFFLNK